MEIPDDDVGIELMNETFRDMGILVEGEWGYEVARDFRDRIEDVARREAPEAAPDDPEFRDVVVAELKSMGIPPGFEPILANWVIHAIRIQDWDASERPTA